MRRIVSLGLALLVVAGCSSHAGQEPDSTSTGTSVQDWDPKNWEPTVQITRPVISNEEREDIRNEVAMQHVSDPDLRKSLPAVAVVSYMDSFREQEKKQAECMTNAGFSAKALESGGISYGNYPPSQEKAFQLASYTCQMQYPFDPALSRDWTPEQIGLVYDYWNEYMIPCLESHGHKVDVSTRPSRESYIQNFFAPDGSGRKWYPTGIQASLENEGGHDDVVKACPALPPSDVMYGVANK